MIEKNPQLSKNCHPSDSLLPPRIIYHPEGEYLNQNRVFEAVPCLERTPKGRIFYAFYTGKDDEGCGNVVLLFKTDDEGKTTNEPYAAIVPQKIESCRTFDACLWFAPDGKLWFFVTQSYTYYDGRNGVWAMTCENFDDENPTFSEPRRIANGIMMNKPLVTKSGTWLLPCAIWEHFESSYNFIPEERFSNVYRSKDQGKTFKLLSHTDYEDRFIDEHMMTELSNGKIMMLIRAKHGIGQAFSSDEGKTWTEAQDSGLGGPCARFCIKRLKSGRHLLINHYNFHRRNNLTAMISDDDCKTWKGFLLLDERSDVSYPDCVEDKDGFLYIAYDRERYTAKEILLAKVTEEDILNGQITNPNSFLKRVMNKAYGTKKIENPNDNIYI